MRKEQKMQNEIMTDSVRNRLILSGLKELDKHGVRDFSLRRVADDAGVSCAAPYRHFKDKDELISAIVLYVLDGWKLLSKQITEVFSHDVRDLVAELAVAGLRFWIANGNFRTVLVNSEDGNFAMREFDEPIIAAIKNYCDLSNCEDAENLTFKITTMLYGTVILVDEGYDSADHAADNLKKAVYDLI